MTQQDDITQPVLTDDEIEALAKKHICPHHARLEAVLPNRSPYQKTEQFRRVKALVGDVLSKLRAEGVPVADGGLTHRCANCSAVFQGAGCPSCRLAAPVASAPADERAARSAIASLADEIFPCLDIIDKREGAASGATEKIHDLANAIKRAALASAPVDPEAEEVDFLVRVLQTLETWRAEEWNELIERRPAILALLRPLVLASAPVAKLSAVSEDFAQEVWAAAQSPHGEPVEKSVARVASLLAEASAPVAGEAHPTDDELKRFARSMPARPWGIGSRQCDALAFARALLSRYAAPQASEAVRNQALEEAARVASQNGHYGNLLASSIRALKLPQADKDGGQQHEGVVTDDMRYAVRFAPSSAHWSERLMEFFGPDAREGIDALERQLREARTMLDRQTNLPSGWQLALNLAIDAIENAAPGGQDWPVNWPAILHGLKDLRAALSATQTEQGERDE